MAINKNGQWIQNEFNERLLPDGYTQLEYIESTGTQWIDSNVIMSENISYEAEASIIEQASTSDAALCGTRDSGDNNTRFVTWWNDYTVTGGRINQSYFTNSDSANYVTEYGKIYKLSMKNKVFSVNNTIQKFFTGTVTNPNNLTFALFGLKYSATTTDSRRFKGRIYWFKIWDNNILIRDFIPALRNSDNIAGLYDRVNNVFYTNAGTGEFKYILKDIPSDYIQLEYIQSSGTQYVNTNVTGSVIIKTIFKIVTSGSNWYSIIWSENAANPWGCNGLRFNNSQFQLGYGSTISDTSIPSRTNTLYVFEGNTDPANYYLKINNELKKSGSTTGTLTTNSLYIFANNQNGTVTHRSSIQLYQCQIWQNNELVRDFIPVRRKSDDTLGLYDKISKEFFTNLGTGTFIAGNPYAETANVKIYKETNALEANEFWEI